ncbi:cupin domain-containing protein [Cytobacillus oceanisediminis]|uniref:cupin domain-containing protein n=1 Tax=Cytobacillus oceanisediminis TaxID=665099 RepID=UPI001C23B505|nr:cupin domain-containing protein [Cytobacillus oceanisediminis]MBU8769480.1 cupin domain-containing protein [Cytobacillus oceanisediminis]MCM3392642.1 cupin domain-containing protein [Cytobacillus oceanisediminis]
MDVLNIEDIQIDSNAAVPLKTVFSQKALAGDLKVGTVVIPPGKRVPLKGVSNHKENEYSIIVKGSIVTETKGRTYRVSSGDATFIPAGQEHIAYNDSDEDCEIVWVLVG